MGLLKAAGTTALAGSGLVDDHHLQKLRAVSITTVEELMGAIQADPEAVTRFTEISDLAQIQADAAPFVNQAMFAAATVIEEEPLAMGAAPPSDVEIEDEASFDTFQSYTDAATSVPHEPDGLRVDLRGRYGPVRHQGNRGTCVGHACAAVMEGLHVQAGGQVISFSPQYVYYQAKQLDGIPNQDGTYAAVAMPTLQQPGVCGEKYWPYEGEEIPGDLTHGAPPRQADADAAKHRVGKVQTLRQRASDDIRRVLDEGRPVEISVPVYRNWRSNPATALTGIIPMPMPLSRLDGGHAMGAVGYGFDAEDIAGGGFFLLRNSWGTRWAAQSAIEAGYGAIPFLYIDRYGWEAVTASL
jgi:C1A family cysteine protease